LAQFNADSLETKLTLVGNEQKPKLIEALFEIYLMNDPEKASQKAYQLGELSEELNNISLKAKSLKMKGMAVISQSSDHEQAMEYFLEALELSEQNELVAEEVLVLVEIGRSFNAIGDYYNALNYLLSAQELAKADAQTILPEVNKVLSQIYLEIGDVDQALILTNIDSAAFQKPISDHEYVELKLQEAQVYERAANYTASLQALNEAQRQIERTSNSRLSSKYYLRKGMIESKIDDKGKAKTSLQTAARFAIEHNYSDLAAIAYNQLGGLYLANEKLDSSHVCLDKALRLSVKANDKKLIRDTYENLYQYYLAKGEPDNAEEFKNLFIEISEFINTEETGKKMVELQTRYELGKKESEIEVLRKDSEIQRLTILKQEQQRNIFIVIIVFSVVIILVTFYLFKIKRDANRKLGEINAKIEKHNKELQALNSTKDKFFSIIGHDVKGPINSLTSFSNLLINHTDSLSQDEIKSLALDLDKSLKNLYTLLENLLNWARSQTGNINLKPENTNLGELLQENLELLSKSAEQKNVSLENKTTETVVATIDRNTITTAVRNLISNAIKFTPEGGTVVVIANEWKDAFEIEISDTGVGMPQSVIQNLFRLDVKHSTLGTNKEKGTGLGLILCKEFIELNNGKINVESKEGEGSTFRISLPK